MKLNFKHTFAFLLSLSIGLVAQAQIQYSDGGDIPTSIRIKNAQSTSNGYFSVDLETNSNGRSAGGISIGESGSPLNRWYLFNLRALNNQLIEDFNINYGGNNHLTVKKGGNVGIGTTTPGVWRLAVNGSIRAKEIKVETGWADFVFEDTYNLPTLKEVEQHIKDKGHLQDIPSAQEVSENGILLGEMNSKLLQKIEELTLYTIEQEKRIQALENQNNGK